MSFPVRCFSCGKCIGNKWEIYKSHLNSGITPSDSFKHNDMGIYRYCCKRMFLGHVDIDEKLLAYPDNYDEKFIKEKTITK